jgi:GntR family transcriptional regulator/MocR family aminotransferase
MSVAGQLTIAILISARLTWPNRSGGCPSAANRVCVIRGYSRSWSFACLEFLYLNRSIVLQLDGMGPLYRQIYRAFRNDILTRALAPGERVPSTRALARLLKVSRNTAVLAYEQLLAEGYLETRVGAAGTVVAPVLPPDSLWSHSSASLDRQRHTLSRRDARLAIVGDRILKAARATTDSLGLPSLTWELTPPRLRYDLRPGRAAFPDLPYALWCRLLGARARNATLRDLDYGPPAGRWELREAIATRLQRLRGIDASPERIVIVNGTQQALDLITPRSLKSWRPRSDGGASLHRRAVRIHVGGSRVARVDC